MKKTKTLSDKIEATSVQLPVAKGTGSDLSALVEKSVGVRVEKSKSRSKSYVLDLRIHSPASLGYLGIEGIDTAPALVRLAKVKGLDVIAVTDYNSGLYIDRIRQAAADSPLTIVPGTVIRCAADGCDDVVLLCLFPESFGTAEVEGFLREIQVPAQARGDKKFIVRTPFAQVLKLVESMGGVALPSRMDKTPHRLAMLPKLVEDYGFRAFDLAYADSVRYFKSKWPKIKFQLFSFSNANALAQVGSRIARVKLQSPGFAGIRQMAERQAAI